MELLPHEDGCSQGALGEELPHLERGVAQDRREAE